MHKIDKSTRQPILFATKWPIPKIPASTYRFERILKRRGEIVRESRHDGLVAWRNIKRVEKRYHREAAAQRHRRRRTRRERTRNKTINRRKQLPWPTNSPFFYLSLSLSLSLSLHYYPLVATGGGEDVANDKCSREARAEPSSYSSSSSFLLSSRCVSRSFRFCLASRLSSYPARFHHCKNSRSIICPKGPRGV